uniref:Uncharacterized protein n=1 Tax=Nesodiprion zhejiangensis nucleopolyhedrovirus TaxID=3135970 RepID=A0AAN0LPE4_9BACU
MFDGKNEHMVAQIMVNTIYTTENTIIYSCTCDRNVKNTIF